jgi:uncharacterized membrane protein YebE (DUF533 family)
MNLNRVIDGLTRSGIGGGLGQPQAFDLLGFSADRRPAWASAGRRDEPGVSDRIGLRAWRAYRVFSSQCRSATESGIAQDWLGLRREQFIPQDPYTREFLDIVLLRAMITAAGSDGHIDDSRRMRILERICTLDMTTSEKMFLMEEIQRPLPCSELAGYGQTPDLAILVYSASVVAVDCSQGGSQRYLAGLAENMELPAALVAALHNGVTSPDASFTPRRRQRFVQDQVMAA